MQGRFNALQKSMLQWDQMHPYSAIHVVRLRGALDLNRLRATINTTLENRGLTQLDLNRRRFTYQYEPGPAECELRALACDGLPMRGMVQEIERQLNLPFDHERSFRPFRFVVVPAGDSFLLGLIYFHPVADAESVVFLLQDIVTTYFRGGAAAFPNSLNLYPDSRARLLSRHPSLVARKLFGLPAQIRNLRQSHRPHFRDTNDLANGFVCFSLGPEELRGLVAVAKSWSITVNDLFITLLLKSLSPCACDREKGGRRTKISIGCIVNTRKDIGLGSQGVFGLFLGSFTVTHKVPPDISLKSLAEDIRRQTSEQKRQKLYLASVLEFSLARFAFKLFSPARQKRFYAKHYPLWGGITNLNLNSLWAQDSRSVTMDYFRAVSTGPATPLVLSATTFGERVNLGLSYRTAVFSKTDIDSLQCRFREHLAEAVQQQ
jgi:hypothetical protein